MLLHQLINQNGSLNEEIDNIKRKVLTIETKTFLENFKKNSINLNWINEYDDQTISRIQNNYIEFKCSLRKLLSDYTKILKIEYDNQEKITIEFYKNNISANYIDYPKRAGVKQFSKPLQAILKELESNYFEVRNRFEKLIMEFNTIKIDFNARVGPFQGSEYIKLTSILPMFSDDIFSIFKAVQNIFYKFKPIVEDKKEEELARDNFYSEFIKKEEIIDIDHNICDCGHWHWG